MMITNEIQEQMDNAYLNVLAIDHILDGMVDPKGDMVLLKIWEHLLEARCWFITGMWQNKKLTRNVRELVLCKIQGIECDRDRNSNPPEPLYDLDEIREFIFQERNLIFTEKELDNGYKFTNKPSQS